MTTTDREPCRDYDPNFKLHGCELDAGHPGPHRDLNGHEWEERLPEEPWRCEANRGDWRTLRCVTGAGHGGLHRDEHGNKWGEPGRGREALAVTRTSAEAEAVLNGMNMDGLLEVARGHGIEASRRDGKEAVRRRIAEGVSRQA